MKKTLKLSNDPWSWPDPSADELHALADGADGPTAPLFQYAAVRRINAERPAIENGSGFAVLACVRICGTHGLVMPDWLVYAFNGRYDAVLNCRAASWDDPKAFGRPYPKNANLAAMRKLRKGKIQVFNAVNDEVRKGRPRFRPDDFEEIGAQFGWGKTLTDEYYRKAVRLMGFDPIAIRNAERKTENTARKKLPAAFRKLAGRPKDKG